MTDADTTSPLTADGLPVVYWTVPIEEWPVRWYCPVDLTPLGYEVEFDDWLHPLTPPQQVASIVVAKCADCGGRWERP